MNDEQLVGDWLLVIGDSLNRNDFGLET